jgi:hypothetical protein
MFLAVLSLLLGFVAFGCNGGSSSSSTPAITITLEPSGTQTMDQGKTLTITATLANDPSNQGVTWKLSGAGSLSNQTTFSVNYVAPATVSSATTGTVTATSVANTSVTAQLTITVNPVTALTISTTSLPNGTVGVPYSAQLQASAGFWPYTWSISSGALPGWANFDSSTGVISGTPDMTATSNFTVKVTDSAPTPANATQDLSITVATSDSTNNAELKGQYAFLLQGFDDATGNQFAIVGSFIADGNGNVTDGLEDFNGPGGYDPVVALTGKYSVGSDNRGILTLSNSGTSTTFAIAVGSLNSSNVATKASLIEFDDITGTDGKRGSGFVYLQDPNAFNLSSLSGPYAFQFAGQTELTETRMVMTGAYTADGNGNVTKGEATSNAAGTIATSNFTATFSTDGNTASFGRLRITPTGIPLNYVYYIVSANSALAISTSNESTNGILGGQVLTQSSTSFSPASLQGTYVAYAVGLKPDFFFEPASVSAGLWTFNGSDSVSFSLDLLEDLFDFSKTGTLTYTVAANGRVSTSGGDSAEQPGNPIVYLVDADKGFFMTTNGWAASGFMELQTGGPFSNASVSGNYLVGTVTPPITGSGVSSGVGTSPGDGTLTLTLDTNDPTSFFEAFNAVRTVSLILVTDSSGRGEYDEYHLGIFYVVSPKKVVFMANPGTPDLNAFATTVMILEQ